MALFLMRDRVPFIDFCRILSRSVALLIRRKTDREQNMKTIISHMKYMEKYPDLIGVC